MVNWMIWNHKFIKKNIEVQFASLTVPGLTVAFYLVLN